MGQFSDKIIKNRVEINNEKLVEIEIKCKTTNEDEVCSKFFRKLNRMFLTDMKISYPISISKTELIIKGDEYGLKYFNLLSIKDLVDKYFEFNGLSKHILTIEILYFDEVPFLYLYVYKIQDLSHLISNQIFDKVFLEDDENSEFPTEDLDEKNISIITSENQLLDIIEVEYFEDMYSIDKIDYLTNHKIELDQFQKLLKCPIIHLEIDENTNKLKDFNKYIGVK
jgi:hypothetical protein